jgi:ABC-type Fe3+-siderophore transport system permease subunit
MTGISIRNPYVPAILLFAIALGMAGLHLLPLAQVAGWHYAWRQPAAAMTDAVLLHYGLLPRAVMAVICGYALGLSGTLLQHVLRNPLASPSTLGVEAGAQLALGIAILWFPALLGWSRDLTTAAGGFAALGVVLLATKRAGFQPVAIVLAGLVVGLYCTAIVTLLTLMNDHYLTGLFVWGGGALNQNDWRQTDGLLPKIVVLSVVAWLMMRQLRVLSLGDTAQNLGLRLQTTRGIALIVAVSLTTFVVSAVGIIGFVGLAAPAIATMAGARTIGQRLFVAPILGAALLLMVDQLLQMLAAKSGIAIPAGAATALVGGPLLLFVMLRDGAARQTNIKDRVVIRTATRPWRLLAVIVSCLMALAVFALFIGRDIDGAWSLQTGATFEMLLPWRLPRMLAAISAGALLALSGSLLQRTTGNPMAGPEVMGVSSGVSLGQLCILLLFLEPTYVHRLTGGFAGAVGALLLLFLITRSNVRQDNRFLLAGVSLGALMTAILSVALATGDPRAAILLSWMTGSTYGIGMPLALTALCATVVLMAGTAVLIRPLDQFLVGRDSARSRGVDTRRYTILLLALAALQATVATLIVGPLSFVGIMAPHLAQRAGLVRGLPHFLGSSAFGALLMATADLVGRTVHFPWQLPAGLVAPLLGAPLFAALYLWRRH